MAEQSQQTDQSQPQPQVEFVRHEDFESLYANSIVAETSVWDLKVIFGILDQSSTPNKVIQHTSVNLPWTQVKLLSYYIRLNLLLHETQNGKVAIPASIMPPDPDKLDLSAFSAELREALSALYEEFVTTLRCRR